MTTINPEQATDETGKPAARFEAEIKEFVRKDIAPWQWPVRDLAIDNVNSLIGRVAVQSGNEIGQLIAELEGVRDIIRDEALRVQYELLNYAEMNQTARSSMKTIEESVAMWKTTIGPYPFVQP
jgi:hypothetical protein